MLEILAHANLPHELVLVSVHSGELSNVSKHELKSIGELERVDIAEAVLNVRVDDELSEAQDLTAEMESVSETRLLALLGRERLDGLQVHVVIEVKVVEVLAVD